MGRGGGGGGGGGGGRGGGGGGGRGLGQGPELRHSLNEVGSISEMNHIFSMTMTTSTVVNVYQ